MMKRIILLRHGQSQWNLENRFTGWTDVPLSDNGKKEAIEAGRMLKKSGLLPDRCYTSVLKRAISTAFLALEEADRLWIPVIRDWHLNERHYGALQGLDKTETAEKYGAETVHQWRRSFDVLPPLLTPDDPRYPGKDPKYAALSDDELPLAESLQDTIARVRCCWEELIIPSFQSDATVMIAAHGNSLRALAMVIQHLTAEEIVDVEIPTGKPWIFEVDSRMRVIKEYYL